MITREEAVRAVALAAQYLRERQQEFDRTSAARYEDPPHWDAAADGAHDLLEAAQRDGWYGCQLCRS